MLVLLIILINELLILLKLISWYILMMNLGIHSYGAKTTNTSCESIKPEAVFFQFNLRQMHHFLVNFISNINCPPDWNDLHYEINKYFLRNFFPFFFFWRGHNWQWWSGFTLGSAHQTSTLKLFWARLEDYMECQGSHLVSHM